MRSHRVPRRRPSLWRRTDDRQGDPAVVWRRSLGLDRMHAVFPDRAARLFLRPCSVRLEFRAPHRHRSRHAARGQPRISDGPAAAAMETHGRRKPGVDDSGSARLLGRTALLFAFLDQPSGPSHSRRQPAPYRLFTLSNLASFLALIGYPVVVEPFLATPPRRRCGRPVTDITRCSSALCYGASSV